MHDLAAAYSLDALEPHERAQFERHLSGCAECQASVAGFLDAAAALALDAEAPPPPPELRERILTAARGGNVVPLRRRALVPAIAAVAACAALGFGLWGASLHRTLGRERAASGQTSLLASLLAQPGTRRISLFGADGSLVRAPDGRAALVVTEMARAPKGKTWELWVAPSSGAPRPAGLFAGGAGGVVPLNEPVPRGAVVGVTLERAGGATRPTGAMVVRSRVV